nr:ornithine cyclodeaminase family protein [uncultured Flavobacterium sp.]
MITIEFEEIKRIVTIKDLFEPVKQSFIDYSSGKVIASPVNLLHFENNADAHIKIAAIQGYSYFSMKVATMFPKNETKNLPANSGVIFMFNANTGEFTAILKDQGYLTDLRTAAASAIITNQVAIKNANSVSIIGTGNQAFYQVKALKELRNIEKLTIYGRNIDKAEILKEKIEKSISNISINIAKTVEEAVKSSEIIITTTSSTLPLIKANWVTSGQHITAVGADDTFKKELETQCFEDAKSIFVDSIELNKKYGEFKDAFAQNPSIINKTFEFGQLFSESIETNEKVGLTIAKLLGLGVQDLAVATVVMDKYLSKNKL